MYNGLVLNSSSEDKEIEFFSICIYKADNDFHGEIRFKCMLNGFSVHVLPFGFSHRFDGHFSERMDAIGRNYK